MSISITVVLTTTVANTQMNEGQRGSSRKEEIKPASQTSAVSETDTGWKAVKKKVLLVQATARNNIEEPV